MDLKAIKIYFPHLLIVSLFTLLLLSSCGKEEKIKSKSMEEIHQEEGLPVEITTIEKNNFEKELSFFATLSGIKETTQGTMFSERVKKVYAKEGDYVKQNQVIMEFPSDMPMIQYTQAKVAFENAKKMYDRMKELYKSGQTSQQNLDNVKTQYEVSKRNFEAFQQTIQIKSPMNGTLINLIVHEGEIPQTFSPGQPKPLFVVSQLDVIKAIIWVNDEEISYLKRGMSASIYYNNQEFKGKVANISVAMDSRRRAFKVELHFPNPHRLLKSGVTANVKINVYSNPEAITLQRNLIEKIDNKAYVYVNNNGVAQKREVKLGLNDGIKIEIIDGLNVGDKVISCCQNQLSDGLKIKVVS